jgi:hypothetical protein
MDESQRQWKIRNKDKISKSGKLYYQKNRDRIIQKVKEYREKNREKWLANKRKNYLKNYKKYERQNVEYRQRNKKRLNKYKRTWKSKKYNSDENFRNISVIRNRTYRHKKVILDIFDNKCQVCSSNKELETHHLDYLKNIVTVLCWDCHNKTKRKHEKLILPSDIKVVALEDFENHIFW